MGRIRDVSCQVSFAYPSGFRKTGKVIRAKEPKINRSNKGDHATRVELIQFDEDRRKHIRFGYWRTPPGKKGESDWNWVSQTTWVFPAGITRDSVGEAEAPVFFFE